MSPNNKKQLLTAFQFGGLVVERCMQSMTTLSMILFIPWTRPLGQWFYTAMGGQGQIHGIDAIMLMLYFMWTFIGMKFFEGVLVAALK